MALKQLLNGVSHMSKIFGARPFEGSINFFNSDEVVRYLNSKHAVEQTITFEDTEKRTEKDKMYSYYHKVVLRQHAVKAFRVAGYEGEDEVVIDYRLRSMFAKIHLKKPNGDYDIALEDKKNMSKDRLLTFIVDIIHFLETEMGEIVSDSEEFKIWKATGKKLNKIK